MAQARPRTLQVTPPPSNPLDDYLPAETPDAPLEDVIRSVEEDAERRKQRDRSFIAKSVVVSFLVISALLILYVLITPIFSSWNALKEPAQEAATILGSILLPVVTLVLGYYFGTANDRS